MFALVKMFILQLKTVVKMEYKIFNNYLPSGSYAEIDDRINQIVDEGWRIKTSSFVKDSDGDICICILFERPKPSPFEHKK